MIRGAHKVSCPTCGAAAGAACVAIGRWSTPLATPKGQPIKFFHIARRRRAWGPGS